MNDFEVMMKCPPNSIADVLRRLKNADPTAAANAPLITLHLASGLSVSGSLLQFRKDHSHQFVVTIGNFQSVDGTAESLSYIPLAQIAAVTLHTPVPMAPHLMEMPAGEDVKP